MTCNRKNCYHPKAWHRNDKPKGQGDWLDQNGQWFSWGPCRAADCDCPNYEDREEHVGA